MNNKKIATLLITLTTIAILSGTSYAVVIDVSSANSKDSLAKASKPQELRAFLTEKNAQRADFEFWEHIGKVGMGTGIYLGNGYVLTSAHVGCYPFRMENGSFYRPVYESWKLLRNADGSEGDLATFRITLGKNSALAKLAPIPISANTPAKDQPLVLMGSGLQQSGEVSAIRSNGKILAVLGYHTEARRAVTWGVNLLAGVPLAPIKTGKFNTHCFTTRFGQSDFEAQAAHGDSGGPAFAYNQKEKRWELAGCIIAVTQQGLYVPVGSQTFIADLAHYISQLPSSNGAQTTQPVKAAATDVEAGKSVKAYPALIDGVFPD